MNIRKIIKEELQKVFESDYYDRYPDFLDPQFNPQIGAYPPVGITNYGTMMKEEMKKVDDITDDLVLVKDSRGIDTFLVVFNIETSRVMGIIAYNNVKRSGGNSPGDNYQVSVVASEKGYGPLMYELAMMDVSPKGLMPTRSGDVSDSAREVWKKFYDRSDIKKEEIENHDSAWHYPFDSFLMDDRGRDEMLKIYNSKYYKSGDISSLLSSGESKLKEKKIRIEDVIERGMNFFSAKYA